MTDAEAISPNTPLPFPNLYEQTVSWITCITVITSNIFWVPTLFQLSPYEWKNPLQTSELKFDMNAQPEHQTSSIYTIKLGKDWQKWRNRGVEMLLTIMLTSKRRKTKELTTFFNAWVLSSLLHHILLHPQNGGQPNPPYTNTEYRLILIFKEAMIYFFDSDSTVLLHFRETAFSLMADMDLTPAERLIPALNSF